MCLMEGDELRKKLYQEKEGPRSAMDTQKEKKKKLVYSFVVVGVVIIIFLGVWSLFTAPPKDVLPPQACFKNGLCLELIFADTAESQEIGYSNYSVYPEGKAMIFPFDPLRDAEMATMWMKDMKFPIDILWVSQRNRVMHLEKSAQPCDSPPCEIFSPTVNEKVKYVIEIPAGTSLDNSFFVGDLVTLKNLPK